MILYLTKYYLKKKKTDNVSKQECWTNTDALKITEKEGTAFAQQVPQIFLYGVPFVLSIIVSGRIPKKNGGSGHSIFLSSSVPTRGFV